MKATRCLVLILLAVSLLLRTAQSQWVQTSLDAPSVNCFAGSGTYLFAGTLDSALYRSTDEGAQWTYASLLSGPVQALYVSEANLVAGLYITTVPGKSVFVSSDHGTSWKAGSGLMAGTVLALAGSGATVFAGTEAGVFISTDSGMNWTSASTGIGKQVVMSLAVIGRYVIAGTNGVGVYRSTDNGTSWTAANEGLTNNAVWSLATSGMYLYAGVTGGVFRSSDSATSWVQVDKGVTTLRLAASGPYVLQRNGPNEGRVFLSTNCGTNWLDVNAGLTWDVWDILFHHEYVFACAWRSGVWRRPLADMVTGIEGIPQWREPYALRQNYPNPFNPTTVVRYQLPVVSDVKLVVYDILGREVSVLVNEKQVPGSHEATFDGAGLASGVYFYRIQAGSFIQSRKMMLIR